MWGLSSATICPLHNCIHPPGMELSPLKTACGGPCGRVMIFLLLLKTTFDPIAWNAFVIVQLQSLNDPRTFTWGTLQQFSVLERSL